MSNEEMKKALVQNENYYTNYLLILKNYFLLIIAIEINVVIKIDNIQNITIFLLFSSLNFFEILFP